MSISGALAEVLDKLKRSKPGSMNADLVTTLRELVSQCDYELKLQEEAIVSGVEGGAPNLLPRNLSRTGLAHAALPDSLIYITGLGYSASARPSWKGARARRKRAALLCPPG